LPDISGIFSTKLEWLKTKKLMFLQFIIGDITEEIFVNYLLEYVKTHFKMDPSTLSPSDKNSSTSPKCRSKSIDKIYSQNSTGTGTGNHKTTIAGNQKATENYRR
jgi:hypothetical protein